MHIVFLGSPCFVSWSPPLAHITGTKKCVEKFTYKQVLCVHENDHFNSVPHPPCRCLLKSRISWPCHSWNSVQSKSGFTSASQSSTTTPNTAVLTREETGSDQIKQTTPNTAQADCTKFSKRQTFFYIHKIFYIKKTSNPINAL